MVLPDHVSRQNSLSLSPWKSSTIPSTADSRRHRKPPLPLAAAPSRRRSCPLSSLPAAISFDLAVAPFLFCLVLTWHGFRVRSTAAVASTSLPAVRDRSVGVKRGQNPNIGVEAAVSKHWGEKRTNPKHWGFPDYYPFFESLSCSDLSGMTAAYLYTILPRFLPRGRKWLSAQSRWGAAGRGSSVRIHGAQPLMRG